MVYSRSSAAREPTCSNLSPRWPAPQSEFEQMLDISEKIVAFIQREVDRRLKIQATDVAVAVQH